MGSTCPRVTTDASGRYRFVNVANGNWSVVVLNSSLPALAAPQTWQQTGDPDQAGVPCTTCDNTKSSVAVSGGNIFGAYDFGYRRAGTSSIGDTLYADWNGNGTQGAGEEGIANVTVTLIRDVNGDGVRDCGTDTICGNADDVDVVRAVTSTNASGNYSVHRPARGHLDRAGRPGRSRLHRRLHQPVADPGPRPGRRLHDLRRQGAA